MSRFDCLCLLLGMVLAATISVHLRLEAPPLVVRTMETHAIDATSPKRLSNAYETDQKRALPAGVEAYLVTSPDTDIGTQLVEMLQVEEAQVAQLIGSAKTDDLRALAYGDKVYVDLERGVLNRVMLVRARYPQPPYDMYVWYRERDGFRLRVEYMQLEKQRRRAMIQLRAGSDMLTDALHAGIPHNLVYDMAHLLRWNLDLTSDLGPGDRILVEFDALVDAAAPTEIASTIAITYLEVDAEKVALQIMQFGDDQRSPVRQQEVGTNYYLADGSSIHKTLMRYPLDGFKAISSPYTDRRKHPVLHSMRMHTGTDFPAPLMTPVVATGAGEVIFAGEAGGFGNLIVIEHKTAEHVLLTKYGHLNGFLRGITQGTVVRRGQPIGTVGSTGLSTGPHLHYEVWVDEEHVDPVQVNLPNDMPVDATLRPYFDTLLAHTRCRVHLYARLKSACGRA